MVVLNRLLKSANRSSIAVWSASAFSQSSVKSMHGPAENARDVGQFGCCTRMATIMTCFFE